MLPFVAHAARQPVVPSARPKAGGKPAPGFAAHLSAAHGRVAERRQVRQRVATNPIPVHDDWATVAHARYVQPTIRPPGSYVRSARHHVTPTGPVRSVRGVPSAPSMPEAVPSTGSRNGLDLSAYPRPLHDNGRGLHWIPTTSQSPEAVDRFVEQAKQMHASWVVFLNDAANVGANDYLVKKLVAAGIEPVMRIYTPGVGAVPGDVEGMVRHYTGLGVHYYQIGNEPNLRDENGGAAPDVDRFLDGWIPAARAVAAAGGLPGLAPMAPNGDVDDRRFLRAALEGLKARRALDVLDRGWIALHNYVRHDGSGFSAFRDYDAIARGVLGRSLPIIGTEGGTTAGNWQDDVSDMKYMARDHEPYFFANTLWVLANKAGGGHDPQWEKHALIRDDGASPVVDALRTMA